MSSDDPGPQEPSEPDPLDRDEPSEHSEPSGPPASRPDTPDTPDTPERSAPPDATVPERTPLTQQLGRGVLVLLAVLFGVFAVANSHYVDFSWVFGGTEVRLDAVGERLDGGVPLIVLLVGSFLLGGVITAFAMWQSRRAQERRDRREAKRSR